MDASTSIDQLGLLIFMHWLLVFFFYLIARKLPLGVLRFQAANGLTSILYWFYFWTIHGGCNGGK